MANEYAPTNKLYEQYNKDGKTEYYAINKKDFNKFITVINQRLKPGDTSNYTMAQIVTNINDWLNSDVADFLNGNLTSFEDEKIENLRSYVFMGMPQLRYVSVPAVTNIGSSAFANCQVLNTIYAPNTTTVAADAFAGVTSLKDVHLGNTGGTTIYSIGGTLLRNQTNLTTLKLSDTGNISANTFASKTNGTWVGLNQLTTVELPNMTGKIGNDAFRNCSALTKLNIPQATGAIGANAFTDCTALETLYLPEVTDITSKSGDTTYYAFGTNTATEYKLKNLTLGISTTMVDGLYGVKNSLEKITLSSCISVAKKAFQNCSKLSSAIIPELKSINANAFDGTAITKLEYPKIKGDIGAQAFANCSKLTEIAPEDLGSTATFTQAGIFSNCNNLTKVHLSTATFTGANIFSNCNNLSQLQIDNVTTLKTNKLFGVANSTDAAYRFEFVSFPNVAKIEHISTFAYCSNLLGGDFPALTQITSQNTFAYCTDLTVIGEIKQVPFTETYYDEEGLEQTKEIIKSVGLSLPVLNKLAGNDFIGCTSLTTVNLPALATSVPTTTFASCSKLTTVILGSEDKMMTTTSSASLGAIFPSANETLNKVTIYTSYINNTFTDKTALMSVNLPETIRLGNNAFKGCVSLDKINADSDAGYLGLPKIKTIGTNAFEGCTALTEVNFGNLSTELTLGNYAFSGCTGLISANLGPTAILNTGIFRDCNELRDIQMSSATQINASVFNFFSNNNWVWALASTNEATPPRIYAPAVTAVAQSAFQNTGITKIISTSASDPYVYLTNSNLTTIGASAFRNCTKLTEVYLPKRITAANYTTIGANAFQGCTNLTKVSAPSTSTLNTGIFTDCKNLKEVYFGNTVTIPTGVFNNTAFTTSTTNYRIDTSASQTTYNSALASARSNLTKATFPAATTINKNAFFGCVNLSEISMPALLTITSERFNTYSYPSNKVNTEKVLTCCPLVSAYMPALTTIGTRAFQGMKFTKIVSIFNYEPVLYTSSLQQIGANAFEDCDELTKVFLPKTMISGTSSNLAIGTNAFFNCPNLVGIQVEQNEDGYYPTIGESVFYNAAKNFSIYCDRPDTLKQTYGWDKYENMIIKGRMPND